MIILLKRFTIILPLLFAISTSVGAVTFTNLHNFTATSGFPSNTNADGANPYASLVVSGNVLYGAAYQGGSTNDGTLFRLNTDGTAFTNLYNFTGIDGKLPYAGLVLSGNTLYGTTSGGGTGSYGTVFRVNTDGTGHTNLVNFVYSTAGNSVLAGLVLSSNTLYGATDGGGTGLNGTVYQVNTDGTGFSNVYSFTFNGGATTNTDGRNPDARLILSGSTLFGTTVNGGLNANGTIFRVNADGTGFTNLHDFTASSSTAPITNSDGRSPHCTLVLSGNTLYGTARLAGTNAAGTIYKINTDGTGFTVLHSFPRLVLNPNISTSTNSDGAGPWAGVILSGNTLYGAAITGGTGGSGTVFQMDTDGGNFTVLHTFTSVSSGVLSTNSDGAIPYAGLILSGNTLYGTTESGGTGGSGTVFSITLPVSVPTPIPLQIRLASGNAVVTWTDPASAFSLQAAMAASGVYSNVPGATSPFTNPVSGSALYFRLKSN